MNARKSRARRNAQPIIRRILKHLVASALCIAFAAVYGIFSHGVDSPWMTWMFLCPLLLGALPSLLIAKTVQNAAPIARQTWVTGIMALTLGSCFRGVLEIYGTASPLEIVYPIIGTALLALGGMLVMRTSCKRSYRSRIRVSEKTPEALSDRA